MWSSRRPCRLSSAISFLTSRWMALNVPGSSTRNLGRAIRSGSVGVESVRDKVGTAGDALQFGLERGRFLAIGMTQPPGARGEVQDAFSGRVSFSFGFLDEVTEDLAVALGCDRQAMFEIPCREAAFVGIVPKFDLALFQRLSIGRADDRQQYAAPGAVRQQVPVDIERYRVR